MPTHDIIDNRREILVDHINRILSSTEAGTKVFRLGSTSLDQRACLSLEILQALQIASADGNYILIDADCFQQLRQVFGYRVAQSEEELWQSQQDANERAREAEEYVVEYERQRLQRASSTRLAESVERISKYDARANYDVRSFEVDGNIRYIEVKSSTNLRVEFYWSKAERDFAQNKGASYWIYFIPRSYELPNLRHGLVLIQNPHALIGTRLSEEVANYKVTLTDDVNDIQPSGAGPDSAKVINMETSKTMF